MLTKPLLEEMKDNPKFNGYTSYIMASYINYIESAGGRAVPLIYDADINKAME